MALFLVLYSQGPSLRKNASLLDMILQGADENLSFKQVPWARGMRPSTGSIDRTVRQLASNHPLMERSVYLLFACTLSLNAPSLPTNVDDTLPVIWGNSEPRRAS